MPEKKIKFVHVESEKPCNGLSYVVSKTPAIIYVFFAFIDTGRSGEITHQGIYDRATEEPRYSNVPEPSGGGTYKFRTDEVAASIQYGYPDDRLNDFILEHFQSKDFGRRC